MMNNEAQRFWSKVDRSDEHGCWLWQGNTDKGGYGRFRAGGKSTVASRWAYATYMGVIPPNLQIDHLCFSPGCVNPLHLEPVTPEENIRRQRHAVGERHGNAKLTEKDVLDIYRRTAAGQGPRAIAKSYGVNRSTIHDIKRGVTWTHITPTKEPLLKGEDDE